MADGSQKQKAGDIDADGSVQIAQAKRDANSVQNSPGATIDNRRSIFGWGSRQPKTIDWEIAAKLMERQATDVENRLEQMLFGIAAIGLTPTPQEVAKLAATKILTIDETSPEIIDPIRPILDVYDRPSINGSLLILGTPGAGKTTTLLSLAQQLIGRELANLQQRSSKTVIPLIFELSTWRDDQQSIGDWLVAQLYENYGGDRKSRVYETWLEKQVLLPLLDGLDELGLVRQQKCMEQINQFARTYPQLVVCCRVKEYRQVGVKLSNLRGAVQLEPLSDRQIASYLAAVGKSALWEQIQTVPEMHNLLQPVVDPENPDYDEPGLLRVPLFISLAAQVFEADWPLKGKADLFDRYIDRQLSFDVRVADRRKEVQKRDWSFQMIEREPNRQFVKHTLSWVAQQLNTENFQRRKQVDLLIERMQPSWLTSNNAKWKYRLVLSLIFSLISGFIFSFISGPSGLFNILVNGPIYGIAATLAIGLNDIEPTEGEGFRIFTLHDVKWEISLKFLQYMKNCRLIFGLLLGLIRKFFGKSFILLLSVLLLSLLFSNPYFILLYFLLIYIVLCVFMIIFSATITIPLSFLPFNLINSLIRNSKKDIKIRLKPNQGIWNSCQSMIWTMLFLFLCSALFLVRSPQNIALLIHLLGGCFALSVAAGGGAAIVKHLGLRIVLTRHYGIPWNLARFLTYCHERRLLQQIGGRYRFIHRELLDHFAGMEN